MSDAVVQRLIPADPDAVYDAWIDPESLLDWMCPRPARCLAVVAEPRIGGRLRIDIEENGIQFQVYGEYTALDRPTRLGFTWSCSTWPDPTLVTHVLVTLAPRGEGQTLMTITHSKLAPDVVDRHRDGWERIADQLRARMSRYQLRPAQERDKSDLLRIHLAAMSVHLVTALGEWTPAQAREHLDRWLDTGRAQVIVVDGVTAGLLDVVWKPDALHVIRVELDPSLHGRGIGTHLMADLLAEADARGVPVLLDVFEANPARRLYERLGFQETGRDGPSVHMKRSVVDS